MTSSVYGFKHTGEEIEPPRPARFLIGDDTDEWEIIPEGGEIPQEHRCYIETYGYTTGIQGGWAAKRSCHSTMTPSISGACIWGGVRAFAKRKLDDI